MLEIHCLSVGYRERMILRDISLTVHPGEVVALIGPNGAGKSTLIRAVSGVISPKGGMIHLCGNDLSHLTSTQRARKLAVVPQAGSLAASFTVFQTILLGRTPHLGWLGQAGPSDLDAVHQAMGQTGTHALAERCIGELSGGEQQRVLLARALAQETPILIMDEPTNHLDIRHQTSFLNLARQLAVQKGLAILVALHDLNLTSLYADRVGVLAEGELMALGTPAEVFMDDTLSPIYGSHLQVIMHPEYGTPLVLPAGPDAAYAPSGFSYRLSSSQEEKIRSYA